MLRFKKGDIIETRWSDGITPIGTIMTFLNYDSGHEHFDAWAYEQGQEPIEIFTPAFWFSNGRRHVLTEQAEDELY